MAVVPISAIVVSVVKHTTIGIGKGQKGKLDQTHIFERFITSFANLLSVGQFDEFAFGEIDPTSGAFLPFSLRHAHL